MCDKNDVDEILSLASIMDPTTADIYEPSYWTIFGCHNGKHQADEMCPPYAQISCLKLKKYVSCFRSQAI